MKLELTEKEVSIITAALRVYEDLPYTSDEQYYIAEDVISKICEKVEANEM